MTRDEWYEEYPEMQWITQLVIVDFESSTCENCSLMSKTYMPNHTVCRLIGGTKASTVSIGVSVCSKKDQFCKKTGRDIAYGRMGKRPYGEETFSTIDTNVFKSKKGRKQLHNFILDTYINDVHIDKIKRHIYKLNNQIY